MFVQVISLLILLQNSLLHNSQYASGLKICTLPPADRGGALDDDDIGIFVDGILPLNGDCVPSWPFA